MDSAKINEVKRTLTQNKEKFRFDLQYICKLFNVDADDMLKKYDYLSESMIKHYIAKDKIDKQINDVSYGFEKLKVDFIVKNNIDVRDKVLNLSNGDKVLDELYKIGFINNDMFEVIKEELWRKRKTQPYEFAKWL